MGKLKRQRLSASQGVRRLECSPFSAAFNKILHIIPNFSANTAISVLRAQALP
jgi:hypothetical protein